MTKCWQPVSRPNAGRPSVVPPAGDCPPDICMFCPRTAAKLHSTHRPGLMVTLTSGQLQRCSRTLQHAAPRHSVTKYISTAPYCTKYKTTALPRLSVQNKMVAPPPDVKCMDAEPKPRGWCWRLQSRSKVSAAPPPTFLTASVSPVPSRNVTWLKIWQFSPIIKRVLYLQKLL